MRKSMKRHRQEMSGVMLVLLIFLQLNDASVRNILDKIGPERIDEYVSVFSQLLMLLQFLKQDTIHKEDVARLHDFYRLFMAEFVEALDCQKGAGANLRKWHYMLHTARDIARYASPKNYTGHVPESLFKYRKNDARRTQKRVHSLDFQSAVREIEGIILQKAAAEITYK